VRVTEDSKTLRSRFGVVITLLVWVVCAVPLVTLAVGGQWLGLLRWGPLALFAAFGMWLLFWSPSVTIAPGGVEVRNLLRSHAISWPAIEDVDTRYALRLTTPAGRITAWAAPAPSSHGGLRAAGSVRRTADAGGLVEPPRADAMLQDDSPRVRARELHGLPASTYAGGSIRPSDIPTSDSGLAPLYVRRYWDELTEAGHIKPGVVDGTGVVTRWLTREASALVGLTVLAAACLALVR
jgi:hypothetical protein